MLILTLEIWPFGQKKDRRKLGTMTISNIGGTHEAGDYEVMFEQPNRPAMHTYLSGYKRSLGAWTLVLQAMLQLLSFGGNSKDVTN